MTRSAAIRDRVAAAIIEAAADLLAEGGEPPSMGDVAQAAGVARATLYRYFPNREQLLEAVAGAALDATASRFAEAELDTIPVREAIARVVRLIATLGSKYSALVGRSGAGHGGAAEQELNAQIDALLRRGVDDGTLRDDLSIEELAFLFGSLLESSARVAAEHRVGVERVAAVVTSAFLRGTERQREPTPPKTLRGKK